MAVFVHVKWIGPAFISNLFDSMIEMAQTIRMGNYHRTENGVPVIAPPNLDQAYTGYQRPMQRGFLPLVP